MNGSKTAVDCATSLITPTSSEGHNVAETVVQGTLSDILRNATWVEDNFVAGPADISDEYFFDDDRQGDIIFY